jgi:antitoxin PrlF
MKVTTKGQVTIPQEFRNRLGIQPGAEVEFSIDGEALKITPVKKVNETARRLVQRLRGSASLGMSTDEIMSLTRGEL